MSKQIEKPRARKAASAPASAAARESEVTEADFLEQLALAQRIEEQLQMTSPAPRSPVTKTETFMVSLEDGKRMTACDAGKERDFMQWVFGKAHMVLAAKNEDRDGSKLWLLEALKAVLLSSKPKTPIEAMLVAQSLTTHELAMEFGARALRVEDPSLSSKLTARYCQLASLACQQAEAIQRIRGEAGRQSVTVEHLNVEQGGRAVVGQVNAQTPGEERKS